jgi:membrane-associated protein
MATGQHHHALGLLGGLGVLTVCAIVLALVFLECAFIIGLFLPGDSLLFTAGVILAQHGLIGHAWALAGAAIVMAVGGNMVGYLIGRRAGTTLLGRRGGRVLTADRMYRARTFLNRHGWWSVVLARWLPWVRTLAPLVAGACRMDSRRFLAGTSVGAALWVPVLVLAGFYGAGMLSAVPWLKTTATVLSVAFFVVGTALGIWRYRQEMSRAPEPVKVGVSD